MTEELIKEISSSPKIGQSFALSDKELGLSILESADIHGDKITKEGERPDL